MTSNMTPEIAKSLSAAEQHEWYRRVVSRRALLRGGLVGAGAVIAGPSLLGGTASATQPAPVGSASLLAQAPRPVGAAVVPFGRHLAFGADPTDQVAITWQTPALVKNPFVRIGTSPWDLGQRIPADLRNLTTPLADIKAVDSVPPANTDAVQQYFLQARLDGLGAGQTYYYLVGHDGWDVNGNLPTIGTFTTAPDRRTPFTFTAFGDEGVTYDAVATTNLIRAQSPAFHLHAGDVSYAESGGGGLVTDAYDPRVWDSFFNQIEPVASSIPWQVAVGNHEMETWYSPDGYGGQFDRFAFPQQTSYYSFTYSNVAVLSLDANDVSNEIPANLGYSGGAQTTWLAAQLAAYRQRPDIDFIVVYFHHCAYCTCSAHSSEGGVRTNWVPLFDQYSVDLVINGHNHLYERTDPLKGGVATTTAPIGTTVTPATQGTTYITAGGGGESLYKFTAADSYEGAVDNVASVSAYINAAGGTEVPETVTWSRVRYTGYCLVVIESQPGHRHGTSTLTIRGLSETGSEVTASFSAAEPKTFRFGRREILKESRCRPSVDG
jgi:Purple acid Phosphatase, N-terminal domain/Calcineurin-like phosphoesterase